jgi:hypothetical protein
MTLQGKGFFIWKIRDTENGDANAIANLAHKAKLTHVLIKIADGSNSYNIDSATGVDLIPPVAKALRARAIQVWGWHYVYGYDPIGEANIAIQRIHQLGLDGYVIDAEAEYKQPGKADAASRFMSQLRGALPNFPIALSSYRYPSYHPQIPWKQFLEKCDFNMPQVYWVLNHNPAEQLNRSLQEFQTLVPFRPVIPTGAAFKEHGWMPTTEDEDEFMRTAQSLHLEAVNFWEWSNCRLNLPTIWDAIRDYDWDVGPLPVDIAQEYIDALNSHDLDKVLSLYSPTAVHVTSAQTIQGEDAIRKWYSTYFARKLPNATFTLTGFSGTGSSRHLTWTATSSAGEVLNGSDTLSLANGKIVYHYTSFTVT